jgi:hypothetical protein
VLLALNVTFAAPKPVKSERVALGAQPRTEVVRRQILELLGEISELGDVGGSHVEHCTPLTKCTAEQEGKNKEEKSDDNYDDGICMEDICLSVHRKTRRDCIVHT